MCAAVRSRRFLAEPMLPFSLNPFTIRRGDPIAAAAAIQHGSDAWSATVLDRVGVWPASRCLEVGPDGSAIAGWLRERVGPDGSVTTADIEDELEAGHFDLIHCRSRLHQLGAQPVDAVRALSGALVPGGVLIAEAPFTDSVLTSRSRDWVALWRAFQAAMPGADYSWAWRLPSTLEDAGLVDVAGLVHADVIRGATANAELLRIGIEAVRHRMEPHPRVDAGIAMLSDAETIEPGPVWYAVWGYRTQPAAEASARSRGGT